MLTTSVERLEGNNVKLTVTISAEEVDAAIEEAYKKVQTQVKIPGFRPGKAPRPMIDTMVGREYVLQQATETLVDTSYPRALDLEGLRPIEAADMEELPLAEPGADYGYTAEVATRPEYGLTHIDKIEVEAPPETASQEDVDRQLEAARDRYATLVPVEDRGVEKGDFVLLSFVGTVDGEAYDGNTVDKYLFEMDASLMPKQFDDGLLGAVPGQELRIEFEIPPTSAVEEYVGKVAAFDVTVHEIKAKQLPEVDEEFAQNVGGFDSVEDMLADLRKHLDHQARNAHIREKERALRELMAARLEGEVPEVMVTSRAEAMVRDFGVMLDTRGLSLEQYLGSTGKDMAEIEEEMKEQAEQSLRAELALEALFRALDLSVTAEDIDEEIQDFASSSDLSPEDARKRWEDLGLMSAVREQIMQRKAAAWLMENATVTIVEPSVEDESAEEGNGSDQKSEDGAEAPEKKPRRKRTAKKVEPQEATVGEEPGE